ncbi:hypothetical protein [Pseudonocardia humida]|uniref:Uncharacterized protein n=1 Tax=Pseudonocardia humida TaxID=2800819 RepID=A0ABT1A1V4_9PSEU|nr:hypothetical protein [Pseudonocardia humida]MCO1656970.1 hypothetical protein [Pseudonocardia humida]
MLRAPAARVNGRKRFIVTDTVDRTASGDLIKRWIDKRSNWRCGDAPAVRCLECNGSGIHDPACICSRGSSGKCHSCEGRKKVRVHRPGA